MKKLLLLPLFSFVAITVFSQPRNITKKYPSLFWEITGNGLTKPSYLFGTMHVSSKMVFHLPDSFYRAIKSVDVVALETNPESWQEDLVKYDLGDNLGESGMQYPWSNIKQIPNDYLNIRTLTFDRYEKEIESALYSRPSTINNLLYRNYSDFSSDFEENTYLDMYIYQVGKKMGKKVAGVEKYAESMRLMMEAYRDAAKDQTRKQRSYDNSEDYSADKLQEAYRTGNLDLLDSINRFNSFSDAFDEKFLYSRNKLQANSIDSIIKSRSALFVGVGAAHLPGNRGVIELLRKKGYRLRAIMMGERDGSEKDVVEKLRVPVNFNTHFSDDSFFRVDMPGNFYRFNEGGTLDQLQYADMANGSYYMVTRIKTNSSLWGQSEAVVMKKIDSLLYENIPGKILIKLPILRNGYKGLDITNRTRRGDVQRYNIFITPFEVVIFKMSGNGDYVKDGEEAGKFFGSIQLKDFSRDKQQWATYEPPNGGFSVALPNEPFVSKNGNWQFDAQDKNAGTFFTILRTDIHNYGFAEEDSFDLNLLDESFSNSGFIAKELSRSFVTYKGYPTLNCAYQHKNGATIETRFVIQGPHYYTLIAQGRNDDPSVQRFFNSFEIKPFLYKAPFSKKDSTLDYSVRTTYYPADKKIKLTVPGRSLLSPMDQDDGDNNDASESDDFSWGSFRSDIIANDTTGEKIYVSAHYSGRYYFDEDSANTSKNRATATNSWIVRKKTETESLTKWTIRETVLSDTNSSRLIWRKSYYRNGINFLLISEGDTLSAPSSFLKDFYDSFTPDDKLKGYNPFQKKSTSFFNDFFSNDTIAKKRATKSIDQIQLDSGDLLNIEKAIGSVNWSTRKYLDTKKSLINKLGQIRTKASADFLKQLYTAQNDTVEMQYSILENLLQQQNQYSFLTFRDIISAEPPVLDFNTSSYYETSVNGTHINIPTNRGVENTNEDNGEFWDELYDSLQLTRSILIDLMPLVNLDDYKWKVMRLLSKMIDSNLVSPKDYQAYFGKFFIEAKQELKRQAINEKKYQIRQATMGTQASDDDDAQASNDYGNDRLELYAKLLIPFWKNSEGVSVFFQQLLSSSDKKLKYNVMLLLIGSDHQVADSLLGFFASQDNFRYSLYDDLDDLNRLNLFPKKYRNQQALAISKLIVSKPYDKPDSVVFLQKVPSQFNTKDGYFYFFKYRQKKDDATWKVAAVGLLSKDPEKMEVNGNQSTYDEDGDESNSFEFTAYTDTRLDPDEPLDAQIQKELKKLLYSHRKSAREFYDTSKSTDNLFNSSVKE